MQITWHWLYDNNKDVPYPNGKPFNNPNLIYPGQELTMPDGSTYVVQPGDYLIKIAKWWNEENPEEPPEPTPEPAAPEPEPPAEPPPPAAPPAPAKPVHHPRDNPLHSFATYTYSIALYILTPDDINTLTTNPASWAPNSGRVKQCLIASGGKNSGQWARNDNFREDFYFQDLKMTTVIGLNNRSKATNAIDIGFTVLEPYGMSLLDRIIKTANDIRAPNFKAMPYLLEIEFYGHDDDGIPTKMTNQRKRIPIQIIEMKIKVGSRGAEYAIKAVPWNHQALSQSAATTPANFEVKASTVEEFFFNNKTDQLAVSQQDSAKMSAQSTIQRAEQIKKEEKSTENKDPNANKPSDDELSNAKGVVNKAFAVSSFCGGVNAWFTDLVLKKLRATQDIIEFDIHPDIAKSKITAPQTKDVSRSATKEDKPDAAAKAANKDANLVFTDASAFPISAGTSFSQVIDMVMRNSSYIRDQIKDPKNMSAQEIAEKEGKPLNWYKVIPTIQVGPYDYALNKFSTKTTWHIVPHVVYDSKHPNGPSAPPTGSVKKYYYSYTGKNRDVIDFAIDFDTLFYTAVTAGAAKWQADQIQQAQQQKDDAAKVAAESHPAAAELVNRQLRLVSSQPQTTGVGGTQQDTKTVLAGDIQKALYSSSRGDMLNLKLKITGDPELIKQDDIYTNPSQGGYSGQQMQGVMGDNGSIPMDNGEVIAEVEFRTIIDMDESTGNPYVDPVYAKNSVFNGHYKMLTVDNVFSNGRFEQTIDMVRLPDAVNNATANSDKGKQKSSSESMEPKTDKGLAPGAKHPTTQDETPPPIVFNDADMGIETKPATEEPDENQDESNKEEIVDPSEADPDYEELHNVDDNSDTVEISDWNETYTDTQDDTIDWGNNTLTA